MTTKRWIGICLVGIAWMSSPASAQVKQIGRMPAQGKVVQASHCSGCSDAGALWAPSACGSCAGPTMVGPACRPGCGMVLGELLCDVKHGVDRSLRCVLGAILPCGLCQGHYDVCSATVCGGACGGCDSCSLGCDSGCASGGCDSGGCAGGCGATAPTYGTDSLSPTPATPQPMPQPADPFQDDPPAPAQTSARKEVQLPSRLAQRSAPQKRMQIRRTNYEKSVTR